MAGKGKKTFVAGEVLLAQDVNDYLMDQTVMNFASDAARSSAIPTPTQGMVSYQKDTDAIEAYDGTNWVTRVSASVPFAMSAGFLSVTGTATVTLPASRFTQSPLIFATVLSSSGAAGTSATFGTVGTSSFSLVVWSGSTLSTTARTVHWQALQMTSAAASG
jgi:hypothetical protein